MVAIHAFHSGSIKILCDIMLSVAITRQCPVRYAALWQEVVNSFLLASYHGNQVFVELHIYAASLKVLWYSDQQKDIL